MISEHFVADAPSRAYIYIRSYQGYRQRECILVLIIRLQKRLVLNDLVNFLDSRTVTRQPCSLKSLFHYRGINNTQLCKNIEFTDLGHM